MANMNTNGDGSVYIVGTNGSVRIGAGNEDQIQVGGAGTTVTKQLTVAGDFNAQGGGMVKEFDFFSYRTLQGATPLMSGAQLTLSGTAAAGNGLTMFYTKAPLRQSGSIIGLTLMTEDGTCKSGSLSATILVNGSPTAATVGIHTGTIAANSFAKDLYTFNGPAYLQVQLTASSTYLTDTALSCSWRVLVEVEY